MTPDTRSVKMNLGPKPIGNRPIRFRRVCWSWTALLHRNRWAASGPPAGRGCHRGFGRPVRERARGTVQPGVVIDLPRRTRETRAHLPLGALREAGSQSAAADPQSIRRQRISKMLGEVEHPADGNEVESGNPR